MVALLTKDNPNFLAITADCLRILVYGHQGKCVCVCVLETVRFMLFA